MDLRKITGVLATGAMIWAGTAVAVDRPDWTYVQGSYGIGDSGATSSDDTNQWGVGGSLGFADMWHVQAGYLDGENNGFDFDSWNVLVGVHPNVGDGTDLFFDVFYGNTYDRRSVQLGLILIGTLGQRNR